MAKNIIALFGGQGLTEEGMAQGLLEKSQDNRIFRNVSRDLFTRMRDAARRDGYEIPMVEEIADMPVNRQVKPSFTHTVAYPVNVAAFEAFLQLSAKEGAKPNLVAASGQSLGMYSALTIAGALSFDVGSHVVLKRGFTQDDWAKLLHEMNPKYVIDSNNFEMYALIGIDDFSAEEVARQAGVYVTGVNCTGMVNIAGEKRLMVNARDLMKARGTKKELRIEVGAPFHSELMSGSAKKFDDYLKENGIGYKVATSGISIISDVDGNAISPGNFARSAGAHIEQKVKFVDAIRSIGQIAAESDSTLIAFGNPVAVKAVKGWVSATLGKDYKVLSVTDQPSAYATLEQLAA